jgi:hypothetical protein
MQTIVIGRVREERENLTSSILISLNKAHRSFYRSEDHKFPHFAIVDEPIVVFASSRERFPAVYDRCVADGIPLIIGSSDIPEGWYSDPKIPVIVVPNFCLLIQAWIKAMEYFGDLKEPLNTESLLVEAHQATKKSTPSTAKRMQAALRAKSVESIRSDVLARAILGIPKEHLTGFACHYGLIEGDGVEIYFLTRVLGRPYGLGYVALLSRLEQLLPIPNGVHQADEIMFPLSTAELHVGALKEQIANLEAELAPLKKRFESFTEIERDPKAM